MRNISAKEVRKVSGGEKDPKDFYNDVVKPTAIAGATAVAGLGGLAAASVAFYGIEGFASAAPGAMDALQQINTLSNADIADRFNNPYRYE